MPNSMNSVDVREKLVEALRLDLVGPSANLGDPAEVLPHRLPRAGTLLAFWSRWARNPLSAPTKPVPRI